VRRTITILLSIAGGLLLIS